MCLPIDPAVYQETESADQFRVNVKFSGEGLPIEVPS
jgi:hypothetical protein